MKKKITNLMILQQMQILKSDLLGQMQIMKSSLLMQIHEIKGDLTEEMRTGFEEARQHRDMLQEDLNVTVRMVLEHDKKLSRRR